MKQISKSDVYKLANISPDNFLVLNIKSANVNVLARFYNGEYRKYTNRHISMPDFYHVPRQKIWDILDSSEDAVIIKESCDKGAVSCFMENIARFKTFAVTELELQEVIPLLDGDYALYIERREIQ